MEGLQHEVFYQLYRLNHHPVKVVDMEQIGRFIGHTKKVEQVKEQLKNEKVLYAHFGMKMEGSFFSDQKETVFAHEIVDHTVRTASTEVLSAFFGNDARKELFLQDDSDVLVAHWDNELLEKSELFSEEGIAYLTQLKTNESGFTRSIYMERGTTDEFSTENFTYQLEPFLLLLTK